MRVYELARELGTGSHEVVIAAEELGIAATAPASGLTDAEAERIRERLAGDSSGGGATGGDGEALEPSSSASVAAVGRRYRLVRKGSVTAGSVRVVKGGFVEEAVYVGLPERVKGWFDVLLA